MPVNAISGVESPVDFGVSNSRELTLAMLQLKYSEASKISAEKIMDEIDTIQANQKTANVLYQEALKQQKAATATSKTAPSAELLKYMEENELSLRSAADEYDSWSATEVSAWMSVIDNRDEFFWHNGNHLWMHDGGTMKVEGTLRLVTEKGKHYFEAAAGKVPVEDWLREINIDLLETQNKKNNYPQDKAGWDTIVSSMKTHLDTMGTETQRKMVFVQDFMGQYNSYLTGANSVVQQFIQNMGEMARIR
jgi:galactitol-specific phosphotransferase system IIB component